MDGFDLNDPLVCEGIVGDGCGGGRIFYIEKETLFVFDPLTKECRVLLKGVKAARKISKKGCVITIEFQEKKIKFNLSTMTVS